MSFENLELIIRIIFIIAVIMTRNSIVQIVEISEELSLWCSLIQILILELLVFVQILLQFFLLLLFDALDPFLIINLLLVLLLSKPLDSILNAHLWHDTTLIKPIELDLPRILSWLIQKPK